MKAAEFEERRLEIAGWAVNLSSYRLGAQWYCKADSVSPGASRARATGATRQEAEEKALLHAKTLLARTKRHVV